MGTHGWLYYTGNQSIYDYQGLQRLNKDHLAAIHASVSGMEKKAQAVGAVFLAPIPPDKHSIYPEYLPKEIRRQNTETRLDQVLATQDEKGPLPILDLRPTLLEHKAALRCPALGLPAAACPEASPSPFLYYRTDTHWIPLGAYFAYTAILQALKADFPSLQPHSLNDYQLSFQRMDGFGLAPMIWQQDRLSDEQYTLTPSFESRAHPIKIGHLPSNAVGVEAYAIDDPRLPTAVIYRDSFGTALVPYLKEHFSRVVFVWSYQMDADFLAIEQPDIVIFEMVERGVSGLTY
jgi:hypothetical protein